MKQLCAAAALWVIAITGAHAATPWPGACIQTIVPGQAVSATLATSDCTHTIGTRVYYTDVYAFSGTAGQQIRITMNSSAVDAWLDLYDVNDLGAAALESDDNSGGGSNARIPSTGGWYTLPATGTYYIWANTQRANQTGAYTITLTDIYNPGKAASPWPGSCIQAIGIGQTVSARLATSDCTYSFLGRTYYADVYAFSATAGQQIRITMNSTVVDAELGLYESNDISAPALVSDDDSGGNGNARIPSTGDYYTLETSGTYYIRATTQSAEDTGAYTIALSAPAGGLVRPTTVTEFYHPAFDHYFMTSFTGEAADLAAGKLPPWVETGRTFKVWDSPATNITRVCRFFSATFAPKSGHFYSNSPGECPDLQAGGVWTLEIAAAFYMMPAPTGACPVGNVPLYRLYNNGQGGAPNHRYTTDPAVRASMIAAKWIPEGNGADGVFACVPA